MITLLWYPYHIGFEINSELIVGLAPESDAGDE
jgi:hypothetical protein